jgi:hypothetical protein
MQTIIRAITKPDLPPRPVDRLVRFMRSKIARTGGKRLPSPAAMQALRDKHPPKKHGKV